jgi:hypothetical protein
VTAEPLTGNGSSGRLSTAMTLLMFVTVAALSYWFERAYGRWCRKNHPFAAHRARLERLGITFEQRRTNTMELAGLAGDLIVELARSDLSSLTTRSKPVIVHS